MSKTLESILRTIKGVAKTEVFFGDTTKDDDGESATYGLATIPVNTISGAAIGAYLGGPNGAIAGSLIGLVYSYFTTMFGDAGNAVRKKPIIHYRS